MSLQVFNYESGSVGSSTNSSGAHLQFVFEDHACPIGSTAYDLLYSLDVNDAHIDIAVPGVTRIPLIYKVRDPDFSELAYRVASDNEIVIVGDKAPVSLPCLDEQKSVKFGFKSEANDRSKADDALKWAGVFGLEHLSDSEMNRAVEIVDELWRGDWEGHCITPIHLYESKADVVRGEYLRPFYQSKWFSCGDFDRGCRYDESDATVRAFATYEQDRNAPLFGSMSPLLVFTFCPICRCISVGNQ
ncbi:hypothetical protein [Rosistilla oblonga]|uniref:Uncharacterized protein n=1 Tax=Rosistilla oblonga TaxID=2527990 RepID=A0A518J103_9BACT|nr:hypothetical protein [Rosistilla oblonga]QDV59017.1 hypothetical protein Mal33_50420 [Rosistilla oblonga]